MNCTKRLWGGAVLVVLASSVGALAQSQSASYVLHQATANDGGATASSSSYRLDASLGQEAAIGTSSSPRYVLQSGFWGFVGSGLVPVILTAEKNVVDPEDVDLLWSGNNSPYDIYAGTDCTDIFSQYLTQEASNSYTDSPLPAGLTCYSVLATAPGPKPPPPGPVPAGSQPVASSNLSFGDRSHE